MWVCEYFQCLPADYLLWRPAAERRLGRLVTLLKEAWWNGFERRNHKLRAQWWGYVMSFELKQDEAIIFYHFSIHFADISKHNYNSMGSLIRLPPGESAWTVDRYKKLWTPTAAPGCLGALAKCTKSIQVQQHQRRYVIFIYIYLYICVFMFGRVWLA